jgi:arylsulfatase A-like enzyme
LNPADGRNTLPLTTGAPRFIWIPGVVRKRASNGLVWLGALLLASRGAVPLAEARPVRPNIVFILADDLGIGDPRCYNRDSKTPTPNLDRLAVEGLRFTDMHTPSAVCSPTRYGLLTGRYAWRSRLKSGVLWGWSPPLIEPGRLTLPAMLKQRGYTTAGFGKWHLGLGWATREPVSFGDGSKPAADVQLVDYALPFSGGPHTAGFASYFGIPASLDMEPYVWFETDRCAAAPTAWSAGGTHQRQGGEGFYRAGPMAPGFRHDDVLPAITRRAVSFLESQARARKRGPFFAYVPLSSPHDPWLATGEFRGGSQAGPRGDFVVQTDHSVGEILQALDRWGLARHTLVVFTSDNGAHWLPRELEQYGHAANGPWRGQKADIHEGGHRVPCLIRWPGQVKPGTTTGQLACLTDFLATFAEVVGVRLPETAAEDSFSFAPLLTGRKPASPRRPSLVMHSSQGMFAIRRGAWKLVEGLGSGGFTPPARVEAEPGSPTGQLYDLVTDPREQENRFAAEPDRVAQLQAELEDLRTRGRSR